MTRFLSIMFVSAALAASASAQARRDQPNNQDQQQSTANKMGRADVHGDTQQQGKRYYDKTGRDYHNWNQQEEGRYREYTKTRRMPDRGFDQLSPRQQSDYFKWSHKNHSGSQNGSQGSADVRQRDTNNPR
jgi:hypothetical protein